MTKSIIISFAILMLTLSSNAQEPTSMESKSGAVEAEAGIIHAEGNTRSSSYLARAGTSYRFYEYLAKLNGLYLKNETRDNATAVMSAYERWLIGLRLERDLTDRFGIFLGQNAESDKKAGIDRRYNSDIGGRYYVARNEGYYTFTELGYRYMIEEYVAGGDEDFNLIRAYIESEKKWTPTFSSKLWIEYLPNLDESDDYNLNGEASLNAALDNTFSIKAAYLAKYDNMPAAAEKLDSLLITSLIAKF